MGQVFIRRSTAVLLLLVGALCIVCVALLVLLLAPDWRASGGETSAHSMSLDATPPGIPREAPFTPRDTPAPATTTTTTTTTPQEPWARQYRIPRSTLPHHYDLYLHPDMEQGDFTGKVTILIGVTAPMTYLVSHVKKLNVTSTVLVRADGGEVPLERTFEYEPNQFWVVVPDEVLQPGNYSLTMEFTGTLTGSIVGFYRSTYTNAAGEKRYMATSKFQPTDARSAFPCFDEPSFKSTFSTTLIRPSQDYIALSNMPVLKEIQDSPQRGLTEVVFMKSVPMVTYLACFIVCDFQHVEILTKENKPFRVYTTPDQISRANYSLQLGVNVLNYFEDYFKVEYPLPKQDMIAIPDFISGAMEHWGLITYREVNLLYDPKGSSSYNRQRVAAVVAHELAHMWFGNLVTLEWWDDLWLNEGFASYIEYKGVAHYEKDWDMEGQFVVDDLHRVMTLDGQLTSHPIVQPVSHPDEITEIFDTISYSKGASVLRMLEDFLGPEIFRKGVSQFLQKYKYQNAVTRNLWEELEAVVPGRGLNITSIMDTWTRQMGLPVLNVSPSPDDPGKLEVTQTRFLSDPTAVSDLDSPYGYKWDVPVTLISDASTRELHWFMRGDQNLVVNKPPGSTWVKFNVAQYGYYRVNYDLTLWRDLIALLATNPEALSPPDRASLIDDAFNLASAGQLPYPTVLSLIAYLDRETHYIPWATASSHLDKMGRLLRRTEAYPNFRKYMVSLVKGHVEKLGWEDTGSHLDRRKRLWLMFLACSNGYEPCMQGARERLLAWVKDPNYYLSPNTRSLVYRFGMQTPGVEVWEAMLHRYVTETNAQEKTKMAVGLASTTEDWVAQRLLGLATNESVVRSQDYFSMLNNLAKSPWNTYLVWDYVRSHWEEMVDRFTLNNRYLGRMVKYVITRLSSPTHLNDVKEFFEQYPEAGSGARSRKQALEELEGNIKWVTQHADDLNAWLVNWKHQQHP
ncbi:glutamyl aminopeptidase-like [Scylla paramamosain]|uniref:glutamyl aminopeptidase-like n=1 Tax=Scylla paramamosain TaxID=85552 RepID=UPI003082966B